MSHTRGIRLRRPLASRQVLRVCTVMVAMLLAAGLATIGLTNHLFWDDEANTAIYARNLLETGRITAWDGTNLVGYAYGGSLGEDLGQELRVPALPAYVAAVGLFLFEDPTFGGRFVFVVVGVLSIGLVAVWARRYFGRRFPWHLPALILAVSPAYLLYIRNCRYYALGVMFTLLVWIFWTPASSRGRQADGALFDPWSLLRYAGAATAMLALIGSHYLNAAAVLVTLPLCFFDRRFRQPKQYVLLGIVYAATLFYGLWLLATRNPFAADYEGAERAVLTAAELWTRYYMNTWWFLRDLGTHEFFPWCLVPVLALPWLFKRLHRCRGAARRGSILLGTVVVYAVLAAVLTPLDMGKGPTAEIRYVVPVIAIGSLIGTLAVAILWQLARPLAVVAAVLLIGTNFLHPGFAATRFDGTRLWWPPALDRYLYEARHDYQTGVEAMVAFLQKFPPGTTVRVTPGHMVYPAMFYVPKLHYCDQLTTSKKISNELKPMGDYLFVERSRPELWLIPTPFVYQKLAALEARRALDPEDAAGSYVVKNALPAYWQYTSKPEIPYHAFSEIPRDWRRFPHMAVLVREGSPLENSPAVAADPTDADALCRWGLALQDADQVEAAKKRFREALQVDPEHVESHFHLGTVLLREAKKPRDVAPVVKHLEAAIRLDPKHWGAYVNLGKALLRLGRNEQARRMCLAALEIRADLPIAHYNLGNIAAREPAGFEWAIVHYRAALKIDPKYAPAHVNWGILLAQQGKIDEAITHYRAALKIRPGLIQAHFNLAVALDARGQKGDKEQAQAALHKILEMVPADSPLGEQVREVLEKMQRDR